MLLVLIDEDVESAGPALALAGGLGLPVEAVAFGAGVDAGVDATVAPALAERGVARLHVLEHEALTGCSARPRGEALAQLVTHLWPAGVVGVGTERGNEVMAHLAARVDLPLAANCVSLAAGEPWTLTRLRGGGVLLEDAELDAPVKLVTAAPGVTGAVAAPVAEVDVVPFRPTLDGVPSGRLVAKQAGESGVTLATAKVVVSGGRGVGSAEGFAPLEELAGLVGGAVGCSRVVTNNGWRAHSSQVGLTGTRIAPDLYIACGISGATQHWVGCMDARTILAINTDPEAPMVTRAAYAVIGDVQQVLPAIIAEIHRRAS